MSGIKQICGKELTRVFKDRKMIFSVFILPVLIMVGIMSFMANISGNAQKEVDAHTSLVYVKNAPSEFEDFLKSGDKQCELITVENDSQIKEMLKAGDADLWIDFPEEFMESVNSYKTGSEIPQVKTYYNPSEEYSRDAYNTISNGILESYRQSLLAQRVDDLGELTIFSVNSDNPEMIIQDEDKAGGKVLGTMLPYFVTILLFAGAMGIGTDMIAGEKERGTMASLLVSPVKRSSIVLGKVFSLMLISGVSSVVYVGAMVGFMPQMMGGFGAEESGLNLSLSAEQIAKLAALLVAIAFLYSAIIVLISVFAKTVKEANTYVMPAYMLILIMGMTTMFGASAPKDYLFAVPVYNTSLALKGILTQEVTNMQYGMTLGITLVIGVILIAGIAKAFESEKVMSI